LPNIRQSDAFSEKHALQTADYILLNPPYAKMLIPDEHDWSSGKVNSAAVFTLYCLESCKPESTISAILPDVLRSGSRYEKWRVKVSERLAVNVGEFGRFDSKTDVDVFLLSGKGGRFEPLPTWINSPHSTNTIEDHFEVSIGSLVAYRDEKKGNWHPFIFPKILPRWVELEVANINTNRRYLGKLVEPPFIALRRTSSPSDKSRATATIIKGNRKVAVENHLIVLKPIRGGLVKCRKALNILQSEGTNIFLNDRIRCRHLTVGAVKEIPWQE